MVKNLAGQFLDELEQIGSTAKQQVGQLTPGKIVQTAGQQILGGKPPTQKPPRVGGEQQSSPQNVQDMSKVIEQMYGQQVDPKKITTLKQQEEAKKSQELAATRAQLARLKIRRYQEMQQKMLQKEKEREGEIPEYEAGRPGAPRTIKEKEELAVQQRKKQQEAQQPVQLPSSVSKMPGIDAIIRQSQGSKEVKLGKLG